MNAALRFLAYELHWLRAARGRARREHGVTPAVRDAQVAQLSAEIADIEAALLVLDARFNLGRSSDHPYTSSTAPGLRWDDQVGSKPASRIAPGS